jgi:hypothetical protein
LYRVLIPGAPKFFILMTPLHIIALFLGILIPVFLLFLPALIELKKPRDSGPRIIEENMPDFLFRPTWLTGIVAIEEEQKLDSMFVMSLTKIIGFLPNMED